MTSPVIHDLIRSLRIRSRFVVVALVILLLVALGTPALIRPAAASGPTLNVYVGYADNLRASGFFPSPWQGSPNVTFIGTGPTYDSGAIRIDNSSGSAMTVDSVSVTIGSTNYNLWGSNLNVPANGSLILAQTSSSNNFDTSDVSGLGCTPSGLVPQIMVTVGGVPTTYNDTSQVLNTGGVDLANCPSGSNESQPWTQLGTGLTFSQMLGGGNPGAPQIPNCNVGAPVDCATGNFWETYDELAVPGRGIPLDLNLTYSSLAASQNSPLGFGWSFSYGMSLAKDPNTGNVTITQGNGSQLSFTNSSGTYTAPPYVLATLTANADGTDTLLYQRTQEQAVFSSTGQLLRQIDRNGYTTTLNYTNGQLTSVTDPANRGLTFTYGANGDIASVQDPGNRTVAFGYDGNGNLTTITDVNNGITRFSYDASHLLLTRTDPNNGLLTNVYDTSGRVTSQTDPLNRQTTFSYLAGTATITDPKGNVTREHFSNFEPVAVTKGYGTPQEATWTYTYDVNGALGLTSVKDPNGNLSTNTWDARGNLLTHTDALNHLSRFSYDALDDLTSYTDPLNVATTYTYDAKGNVLTVSRPLTGTQQTLQVSFTYGDASHPGDVTSLTDPNSKVWNSTYDAAGNRTAVADPLGDKATYAYDTIGRLTSQVSPKGNVVGGNPSAYTTSYVYNAFGDLTKVTDPLNGITSLAYDGNRNLLSLTDPDLNQTQYAYDADNELTKVTRPDQTTLVTGYDANGNVTSQTDGKNNATSYTFDPLNRLATMKDPLNRTTSYSYDAVGNLLTLTDPSNRTTTYGYDVANELKSITYSDGVTPNVTAISYDADSQLTAMTDGTGSSSYVYDSLHRLTSSKNGANQMVQYGYDLAGNLTSLTYPGNQVVTRTYDDAGRLSTVKDWLSHTTSFSYDPNSNLITQGYPNGTQSAFTDDATDRISQIVDSKGGTTFASFAYTRDQIGQLTSVTPTGVSQGNETYTYTKLNQLNAVNSHAYGYDAADNLTTLLSETTQAFDAANQITGFTKNGITTPFGYDAQGNRLSGLLPSGRATSYSYDQANRLTQVTLPGGVGQIAGGENDSIAVKTDGTVWTWGNNADGELGNGTTTNSNTPVQVVGPEGSGHLSGVTTVAAGQFHDLAVKTDGTVWAWGLNSSGQLGNGTTTNSSTPVQVKGLGGSGFLSGITAVSSSGIYSLALKSDGTVWAWGDNSHGQLGNGTTTQSTTPVQVEGVGGSGHLTGVVAISAGEQHSLALKSDGTVWAWGDNADGQVGNGSTTQTFTTPVQVVGPGGSGFLTGVSAIAAGYNHSLAAKTDGTVWAWGDNGVGELGNGTSGNTSTSPTQAVGPGGSGFLTGVVKVAGGQHHSLAIKSDGTVWTWGDNSAGELGNGTTTNSSTPLQVVGSGGSGNLTGGSVVAGAYLHSLAAKSDGTVWAWGDNSAGELGNGTTTGSTTPVQTSNLSGVTGPVTTYQYDGTGLRAHKTTGGTTSNFAWDYSQGLPLLLTDGSTLYVYGLGGMPIEQVDNESHVLYLHADQLGSTRVLTDSTGTVVGTSTYDSYGNTTGKTGTASTAFQFAGEYLDGETGAYYLRARYYDPGTGQFTSRDLLSVVTRTPYSYTSNNPVNLTDPTGLSAWDLLLGKYAHYLIEQRFMQQNGGFLNEQTQTGIGGTVRFDLVNYATGEFYEIKPVSQAAEGRQQIRRYQRWALQNGANLRPGLPKGDMTIEVIKNVLYLSASSNTGFNGLILYTWVYKGPSGLSIGWPFVFPWPILEPDPAPAPLQPELPGLEVACSI